MYPKLQRISFLLCLLLSCSILFAQQRTISGTITNKETHEPLPGATITIKGTDRITTTNEKGEFKISGSDESVLRITMVGFQYQEISIGRTSRWMK